MIFGQAKKNWRSGRRVEGVTSFEGIRIDGFGNLRTILYSILLASRGQLLGIFVSIGVEANC